MRPENLILGFDTSAAHCAVALVLGDRLIAACHEDMARGQAKRLFPLLEQALSEAGKTWADLDAIGVGIGPGNFTGIRLSVSAARGLALALERPAIGINTFEALAYGQQGAVLSLVDARRDQFYAQFSEDGVSGPPLVLDANSVADQFSGRVKTCIGHDAEAISKTIGATVCSAGFPRAEAIARLANARLASTQPSPAPLYIKPADAAPSRDSGPRILT